MPSPTWTLIFGGNSRTSEEVTTLDTAVTRAKLLMTINSDSVNALTTKPDAMQLLREQVADK